MDPEIKEFLRADKRLSDQEIEENFKRYVETNDLQYRDNILKSFYQRIYNYAQRLQLYYDKTYHFEDSFNDLVLAACESIENLKRSSINKVAAYISRSLKIETINIKRKLFVPNGFSGFKNSKTFQRYAQINKIINQSGSINEEEIEAILQQGNKMRLSTFYAQFDCLSAKNVIELEKIQNTEGYTQDFKDLQYAEVYELIDQFLTPREKDVIIATLVHQEHSDKVAKRNKLSHSGVYHVRTEAIKKLSKLMNKTGL